MSPVLLWDEFITESLPVAVCLLMTPISQILFSSRLHVYSLILQLCLLRNPLTLQNWLVLKLYVSSFFFPYQVWLSFFFSPLSYGFVRFYFSQLYLDWCSENKESSVALAYFLFYFGPVDSDCSVSRKCWLFILTDVDQAAVDSAIATMWFDCPTYIHFLHCSQNSSLMQISNWSLLRLPQSCFPGYTLYPK